jgi:hypothetical protein
MSRHIHLGSFSRTVVFSRIHLPVYLSYLSYLIHSTSSSSREPRDNNSLTIESLRSLQALSYLYLQSLIPIQIFIRSPPLTHPPCDPSPFILPLRPLEMRPQPLIPMFMLSMPLRNRVQTIPHQELTIRRREHCRGDIHQDGGHDPWAEVSGQIGGDGGIRETPGHIGVGEADGMWDRGGGYKWVSGIETGPDEDADESVDKEFNHDEVAEVSLVPVWEAAEDAGGPAVENRGAVLGDVGFFRG